MVGREGISAEGHATMPEFLGDEASEDGPAIDGSSSGDRRKDAD